MRGLRKRTFLSTCVCMALVAGGPAYSSKTSRLSDNQAKKKNSTSTKAERADHPTNLALRGQDRPRGQREKAALTRGGTIGVPASPLSKSRYSTDTTHAPTHIQVAFAPTSSSREVSEALARRKAMLEGHRRSTSSVEESPSGPRVAVNNEDLIREALAHRGTRYRYGGASRGGFDCSGFASYVYKRTRGLNLPHSARAQAARGIPVRRGELRPGDLVFFGNGGGIGHVGIYIGDNKFIHAANRRSNVRVDRLQGWYSRRYAGARRFSPAPDEPSDGPPWSGAVASERDSGRALMLSQPPLNTR